MLSDEQFKELLTKVVEAGATAGRNAAAGAGNAPADQNATGAAALVGQIPACQLGKNKLKRYKKWRDWLHDAENKMGFMGINDNAKKISFLRSCAGAELTEFWVKEARIRYTDIPAAGDQPAQAAHTYDQILTVTKKALLKYVNRDRAIMELFRLEQGSRSFTDFLSEVEDQEYLCRVAEQPITSADLKRISLIAGLSDRTLAEKALAENYDLDKVIESALNRESSRANAEAMSARPTTTVKQVETTEDDNMSLQKMRADLDSVLRRVNKSGKYSRRYKPPDTDTPKSACIKCTYTHQSSNCPADSNTCHVCGKQGHFAKSVLCKKKPKKQYTARRVEDDATSSSDESEYDPNTVYRIDRAWPGVQPGTTQMKEIQRLTPQKPRKPKSKKVSLMVGDVPMQLHCDTGCDPTIIPPDKYTESMGDIVAADCNLRAWGSDKYLDVKGMFHTTLTTTLGVKRKTWVYVVDGTRPEPLLGDHDAEALGIISFNPEGRAPDKQVNQVRASIPARLRDAGFTVQTDKPELINIPEQHKKEAMSIADIYTGSVLTTRTGSMKVKPVKLQYEEGFKPIQPQRYPVPYHYRERLSAHLKKLRHEGIIEDVDPAEKIDCVLNVTISDKKMHNEIRMNIDARPINAGAKHTKYHVVTPQEIRHTLEGATVFTELDMVNGFHQVPLDPDSRIVFNTHEGLHRMKYLFFGPKNSSGIFHHEVSKVFEGIPGCITIHDNVLVYGKGDTPSLAAADHNRNLHAVLKRAKKYGVTFKLNQNTICAPEVKWFGRVWSGAGISADPEKISLIAQAGRPESIADVKSFLQAAAFNAKFAFDHLEHMTYEEATAPLRQLLAKNAVFSWNKEREDSFQMLLRMMSDRTILAPYVLGRPTHLVTDASPQGISASLYQSDEQGRWRPIDHISRALSTHEQGWKSQIEWESLAKMWGMTVFRPYLVGDKFTSWGDQKPLVPIYNEPDRRTSARINKHRGRILDLTFTDKYLPGSKMPADYASRHPAPISHLTKEERSAYMIDDGDDILVMKVVMSDLPPALTTDMIKQAANNDPVYQRLVGALSRGKKPSDADMKPYTSVWEELSVVDGMILRGERIVIPNGHVPQYETNIRDWVVDLGHSGHMGVTATKKLLRLRLWFPGMDRLVEKAVEECLPCQASVESYPRDPLKPTLAPTEPWTKVFCDHWGPTYDKKYHLVLIDALTRYPEVITVDGTSAEANIHGFSEVFSRHGYPKTLHSDGGPPFNYSPDTGHLIDEYFKSVGVEHYTNASAEDPEATGIVEAFMKHIKKVYHTCSITGEDPLLLIHDHLVNFRATPHPTTGKSPAELLFGRKFRTRLPDVRPNPAQNRPDIIEARERDTAAKAKMKAYKDERCHAKPHTIRAGDSVMLKRKSSKHVTMYDPDHYTVSDVWGTQITAERRGRIKTRDAQRWKKITLGPKRQYKPTPQASTYLADPDIGASYYPTQPSHNRMYIPPARRPPTELLDQLQAATPVAHQPAVGTHMNRPETNPNMNRPEKNPNIIWDDTPANRPKRTTRAKAPKYKC